MSPPPAVPHYAREDGPPSYRHDLHAGNVGDVWKHCALAAWLRAAGGAGRRLTFIDTHAGRGRYALPAVGEWSEGIGRLMGRPSADQPEPLRRYLELVRGSGFDGESRRVYPGSPALALAVLRAGDRLLGYETDAEACAALRSGIAADPRAAVFQEDGMAAMARILTGKKRGAEEVLVLIDPPWTAKRDWQRIPEELLQAWRRAPRARFMLWYPIKSYTRVAAMQQRLRGEGLPFACLDLITTPLEHRRRRLNGSGVLLVNADADLVSGLSAAGVRLAAGLAVLPGQWRYQCAAWGPPPGSDKTG